MRRHRIFFFWSLFTLLTWGLSAQEPFVCRGNSYLALTDGLSPTRVYEIVIDPDTEQVAFSTLSTEDSGVDLNAIGYRYTDNFIYGVNTGTLELYRVGRDGVAELLADLDADRYLQFVAGDVSPEGKYLVLVGTSLFHDETLLFIDLDDPNYGYREVPLSGPEVRSADVAFDPIEGTLYGFDGMEHRLVTYDILTGEVRTDFPPTDQALLMGGLFFDTYGNLFGYGLMPGENAQKSFYRIDKETGEVQRETIGPLASRNDGCSCPYNVGLLATVDAAQPIPCTQVPIRLEVWNNARELQEGLQLELQFPPSFEIASINSPLEGELTEGGPGSSFFTLSDLAVPQGRHDLIVLVELGPGSSGEHAFQARLSGLPAQLGELVLSDNPATLLPADSTVMQVGGLRVDFSEVNTYLCAGDSILLDPAVPGATYRWSDGSTEPTLTVTAPGTYGVTVSTGCETVEESITVGGLGLELDLGQDRQIELGESISLTPRITPSADGLTFAWTSPAHPVQCADCLETSAFPASDTRYTLTATDATGCTIADSVLVRVEKNRRVYLPTAFSPNGDGVNDRFYVQSPRNEAILEFRIFDRWGNLLFQNSGQTNDPGQGWDGTRRGQPLNNGVFYYVLAIQFADQEVIQLAGEVQLLK